MRHAFGHKYRNTSFIVDVVVGQIPRSTERISSLRYDNILSSKNNFLENARSCFKDDNESQRKSRKSGKFDTPQSPKPLNGWPLNLVWVMTWGVWTPIP